MTCAVARRVVTLLLLALVPAAGARGQEVVRRVGRTTIRVDVSQAFPGGVVVVRLHSKSRLGTAWAQGRLATKPIKERLLAAVNAGLEGF
jgi:hypothetical protein